MPFCIKKSFYDETKHKIVSGPTPGGCTDCVFDPSNFTSTSGNYVQLSNFLDPTQPIVAYTGNAGDTITVPPGYNHAIYIDSQGNVTEEDVSPGQVLTFRSDIVLGASATKYRCDPDQGPVPDTRTSGSFEDPQYGNLSECTANCVQGYVCNTETGECEKKGYGSPEVVNVSESDCRCVEIWNCGPGGCVNTFTYGDGKDRDQCMATCKREWTCVSPNSGLCLQNQNYSEIVAGLEFGEAECLFYCAYGAWCNGCACAEGSGEGRPDGFVRGGTCQQIAFAPELNSQSTVYCPKCPDCQTCESDGWCRERDNPYTGYCYGCSGNVDCCGQDGDDCPGCPENGGMCSLECQYNQRCGSANFATQEEAWEWVSSGCGGEGVPGSVYC